MGNSETRKKHVGTWQSVFPVSMPKTKHPFFLGFENTTLSLDFPSFGRSLVTPYGRCVERYLARIKGGKNQQRSVRSDEFLMDVFLCFVFLCIHTWITQRFDLMISFLGTKTRHRTLRYRKNSVLHSCKQDLLNDFNRLVGSLRCQDHDHVMPGGLIRRPSMPRALGNDVRSVKHVEIWV